MEYNNSNKIYYILFCNSLLWRLLRSRRGRGRETPIIVDLLSGGLGRRATSRGIQSNINLFHCFVIMGDIVGVV